MNKQRNLTVLITLFVLLVGLACSLSLPSKQDPTPLPPVSGPPTGPQIVLQRLEVTYYGQDGQTQIGSGCPGTDGKGSQKDIHFAVAGVDPGKQVSRIVVAGDNSTLTWQLPCAGTGSWELAAHQANDGLWDIYVAPSDFAGVYTILVIYSDNSVAMGMVTSQ